MEPGIFPRARSDCANACGSAPAVFTRVRMVAPVAPSAPASPGRGHVAMAAGKEISRNTRPVSAGLNMLQPSPPKAILATPMAITEPATAIHHGSEEGRLSASRTPVTTAERSPMLFGRLSIQRLTEYSIATHAATDTRRTFRAGRRKKYSAHTTAGIRATSTWAMVERTVLRVCMCGGGERVSFIGAFFCFVAWRAGYSPAEGGTTGRNSCTSRTLCSRPHSLRRHRPSGADARRRPAGKVPAPWGRLPGTAAHAWLHGTAGFAFEQGQP